jgi:hypothetical protein
MTYANIFSRKKNDLSGFDYELCESSFTRTDCIKEVGELIDSKQNFHHHVDHIFLDNLGCWA